MFCLSNIYSEKTTALWHTKLNFSKISNCQIKKDPLPQ
jgi:hypothetical protein